MEALKRPIKGWILNVLIIIYIICGISAYAYTKIDTSRNVTISGTYSSDFGYMSNVNFDLYFIAEMQSDGTLKPLDNYTGYTFDIEKMSKAELQQCIHKLYKDIEESGVSPLDSAKTNYSGRFKFPNKTTKLVPGLYLLVAESITKDELTYKVEPNLIQIPNDLKYPRYNISLNIKSVVSKEVKEDYGVIKLWNEPDMSEIPEGATVPERPDSVTVNLYRDGVLYDTVILSSSNNWRHIWKELETKYNWFVDEVSVEGYETSIYTDHNVFVITNTSVLNKEEPDNTDEPKEDDPGDDMAQTGVIWWPIQVMYALGLLLLILGKLMLRGDTNVKKR